MKFGIIVFPGTNCEQDCAYAILNIIGERTILVWHKEHILPPVDCVIIPGGFSYGDYLRTGAIAKYSPVMAQVIQFAQNGGLVLGICNGFQILLETGLLPGAMRPNRSIRFICDTVSVSVENNNTPFTRKCSEKQVLNMPIRHAEGNYFIDDKGLLGLKQNKQVVLRYSSSEGEISDTSNPNGSVSNIAGICNESKNVFGLMPHPEAACDKWLGSDDGIYIFSSLCMEYKNTHSL